MSKIIITESQLKKIVEYKKSMINESDRSRMVLAMAKLAGFKLSGYNEDIANKALNNKDLLNKLGRQISNQKSLENLIIGLEEAGLKDADNTIKNNIKAIQHNFKIQSHKVEGVQPVVIPREDE